MPLTAGARLGPYEITSPIGAGGMGEVYKAKDTRLDRTVAIKVLPSHLSDHEELRQRFEQEARAVSSLNHPNIWDTWALGVVLREMLTGTKTFDATSQAGLIAAILEHDPPPLPDNDEVGSRLIDRVLERCLQKRPDKRWQGASDLGAALQWALEAPGQATASPHSTSHTSRGLVWLSLGLVVGLIAALFWWSRHPTDSVPQVRFDIPQPEGRLFGVFGDVAGAQLSLAITPNGKTVVFAVLRPDGTEIYRRPLDAAESSLVPGTENGENPFVSPDGNWIGFIQNDRLKKTPLTGGASQMLSESVADPRADGISWGEEDQLVLPTASRYRVSGERIVLWEILPGAEPRELLEADVESVESFRRPQVLPTGDILVTVTRGASQFAAVIARDPARLEIFEELGSVGHAQYASNRLVFLKGNSIQAVPFDLRRREVQSGAVVLADDASEPGAFVISESGTLVYTPGANTLNGSLAWVGLAGEEHSAYEDFPAVNRPRLSPSGQEILVLDADGGVWVYDVRRNVHNRIVGDLLTIDPIWSSDGSSIILTVTVDGEADLHEMPADGSSAPTLMLSRPAAQYAHSVAPDGQTIAFYEGTSAQRDIWTLRRGEEPVPFLVTDANERSPSFSPDSRWIAYISDTSGRDEVYVRRFPDGDQRKVISRQGGREPIWSRDGTKLFYRRFNEFWVVTVSLSPELTVSEPELLFTGAAYRRVGGRSGSQSYDVSIEGDRLLLEKDRGAGSVLRVVTNVFRDVKAP